VTPAATIKRARPINHPHGMVPLISWGIVFFFNAANLHDWQIKETIVFGIAASQTQNIPLFKAM